MNMFWHHVQQSLHLRVDGETTRVLKDETHGRTLVQDTKLALGALRVGRVCKDTSVQQCSVGVGNHATDVSRAVWLLARLWVLELLKVLLDPLGPVHRVPLVDRVDGATRGDTHVRVSEDEFTQGVVEGEAVDRSCFHGHDKLCRGTVHGETRGDLLGSWEEDILGCDRLAGSEDLFRELEDTEDGADRDTSVKVGRSVNGVADDGIASIRALIEDDGLLFFLRDKETALSRSSHGSDEDIIANHVELLLIVTSGVGGASQTGEVDQGGTTDVVGDGLEGELESMAKESKQDGQNISMTWHTAIELEGSSYVKSPVASGCLLCSSVRNRVRVMMSVLMFSCPTAPVPLPLLLSPMLDSRV